MYLDFIDSQTGWLVARLATGLNFSQGLLFKTEDGGATWSQLTIPLGEPVRFVTEETGWTAGGPTNSELYVTRDGGRTWQAHSPVSQAPGAESLTYQLPVFENSQVGATVVTVSEAQRTRLEFYITHDSGFSWQLTDSAILDQTLALGTELPIHILDTQHWLVAEPALQPSFPANIISLDMATPADGWAHRRSHHCTQACARQDSLFRTTDGGQTWVELPLPETP
jgi:photosystem II stability/assembly factor-like uncharacterized protein